MEEITRTVGALVFKDSAVLLVRHKEGASFLTDTYGLPSGRVQEGETEIDAAVRELEEETGLRTSASGLVEFPNNFYHALLERKGGKVLNCSWRVFIVRSFSGQLKESEETSPEWVSFTKLKELNLIPNVYNAIQNGLKFLNQSS